MTRSYKQSDSIKVYALIRFELKSVYEQPITYDIIDKQISAHVLDKPV